ncbi:MAG TPA: hypothetical protein VKE69_03605, partial [Planctomycetota bacterium]|nr:hypothetical protein [Planctomycetota bacterium]
MSASSRSPVATAYLVACLATAGALVALRPAPAAWNAALLAAIAVACVLARRHRGAPQDLPLPRRRGVGALLVAGTALLASSPTLALPYLSDDFVHSELLGRRSTPFDAWADPGGLTTWRPVPWTLWWPIARCDPANGALAHVVTVAIFVAG